MWTGGESWDQRTSVLCLEVLSLGPQAKEFDEFAEPRRLIKIFQRGNICA